MASEKQIAANRANALRNTGPKTLAGKLKSGRNAYRHGLSRDGFAFCQNEPNLHFSQAVISARV